MQYGPLDTSGEQQVWNDVQHDVPHGFVHTPPLLLLVLPPEDELPMPLLEAELPLEPELPLPLPLPLEDALLPDALPDELPASAGPLLDPLVELADPLLDPPWLLLPELDPELPVPELPVPELPVPELEELLPAPELPEVDALPLEVPPDEPPELPPPLELAPVSPDPPALPSDPGLPWSDVNAAPPHWTALTARAATPRAMASLDLKKGSPEIHSQRDWPVVERQWQSPM